MAKLLFILKQRGTYGAKTGSYGLINSCAFIIEKLLENGIEAKAVQVVDNNDIDREVTNYSPTHVFIEALWVVPNKFEVLSKLHPNVEWIIHLHSKVPFLATEGMSVQWIGEYLALRNQGVKIKIAANNDDCAEQLNEVFNGVLTLPNMYFPPKLPEVKKYAHPGVIHIGCFGALRPLKNTLEQAFLAIEFANNIGKTLEFHINHSPHEAESTDPVYRNLISLFDFSKHSLMNHGWLPHDEFLALVQTMDLGMQVSYTESFNIVAADFIHCNVPIVVSDEISWVCPLYKADPSSPTEIVQKLTSAYNNRRLGAQSLNKVWLKNYNNKALSAWLQYFKDARYYSSPAQLP